MSASQKPGPREVAHSALTDAWRRGAGSQLGGLPTVNDADALLRRLDRCSDCAERTMTYAVIVQHDYRFWSVAFAHRWEWRCRLARWVLALHPSGRFWGENVDIMQVPAGSKVGDSVAGWVE